MDGYAVRRAPSGYAARMGQVHELLVGQEFAVESRPGEPPFWVVFEDDGETGYLYALDARRGEEDPIFDALHIYNADDVGDRDRAHQLEFVWSDDERAVALLINGNAHAMVDFAEPRLMCMTAFPPPGAASPVATHEWDATAFGRRFPQLCGDSA
jgi:hypothetical protein